MVALKSKTTRGQSVTFQSKMEVKRYDPNYHKVKRNLLNFLILNNKVSILPKKWCFPQTALHVKYKSNYKEWD